MAGQRDDESQADWIRRFVIENLDSLAKCRRLVIRAGDVARAMDLLDRLPNICSVLRGRKFQEEAGLTLIETNGPAQSTTTEFVYECSGSTRAGRQGANESQADGIRRSVTENLDSLAKCRRLVIRAGDVARAMDLLDRLPNICSVLRGRKFQEEAGLTLIETNGPAQSTTTEFVYECSGSTRAVRSGEDSSTDEKGEQVEAGLETLIRRQVIENLDELAPLRRIVRAADVADSMGLKGRTAEVCDALASRAFQEATGLELEDAVFRYVPAPLRDAPDLSGTGDFVAGVVKAASTEAARAFGDRLGELGAGAAETGPDLSSGHGPAGPANDCGESSGPSACDSGVEPAPDAIDTAKDLPAVDLCLVSCVKEKRSSAAPAKDLYTSALFTKTRRLVEAMNWPWFILSAEHGLVHPEDEIAPYDTTLKSMGVDERRGWAAAVRESLEPHLAGVGAVAVFAGKPYREFLVPCLRRRGIEVHVRMRKIGKQLKWLDEQWEGIRTPRKCPTAERRLADTGRFYELLDQIERVGGRRKLAECDGGMDWPKRGVYFFFEEGEERQWSGAGGRVVRVGTHGLKGDSKATLWDRLRQHRGKARTGGGNHRGSIFRLLVGVSLARRGDCALPPSWGIGSGRGAAARRLGMTRAEVKEAEAELERRVSATIGRMPFLWLCVPDAPGPESARGRIERGAIALLSNAVSPAADRASPHWLGAHCDRGAVRASGLWNNNHVEERYDPAFLDEMEALIRAWR